MSAQVHALGLGAAALCGCMFAACHSAPQVLDDAATAVADASRDAPGDASPAALCTFDLPASGFSGPLTGQCTASWRAMEAGSVTHTIHHAFTISGIASDTPWTVSDMGILNDPLADYTVDVRFGTQGWHVAGSLVNAAGPGSGRYWTNEDGVVLHLTAGHVEYLPYDHFYSEDVHGSFDMKQPVELHARF